MNNSIKNVLNFVIYAKRSAFEVFNLGSEEVAANITQNSLQNTKVYIKIKDVPKVEKRELPGHFNLGRDLKIFNPVKRTTNFLLGNVTTNSFIITQEKVYNNVFMKVNFFPRLINIQAVRTKIKIYPEVIFVIFFSITHLNVIGGTKSFIKDKQVKVQINDIYSNVNFHVIRVLGSYINIQR